MLPPVSINKPQPPSAKTTPSSLQLVARLQRFFLSFYSLMQLRYPEAPYIDRKIGNYKLRFSIQLDENAKESTLISSGISNNTHLYKGDLVLGITFVIAKPDIESSDKLAETMDGLMKTFIDEHPYDNRDFSTGIRVCYPSKETMLERWKDVFDDIKRIIQGEQQ